MAGAEWVERFVTRGAMLVLLVLVHTTIAIAQDLPAITYTMAEGLPSDEVIRTVHDPAGFLWVGTGSALARFDGQAFKVYGRDEGLDVATGANDIRFGTDGQLWVATNGNGIFRFDLKATDPAAQFTRLAVGPGRASNRVNTFALTPDGSVWAGTDAGVFVGRQVTGDFRRLDLTLPSGHAPDSVQVTSVVHRDSHVWLATSAGIYRCRNGQEKSCTQILTQVATAMLFDQENRLWTGGGDGVKAWSLRNGTPADGPKEFGGGSILRMFMASDGSIFVATRGGRALAITPGGTSVLFETATPAPVMDIMEDAARNVWLGTRGGLVCVRRQGVSLYSARHGLRDLYVHAIFRDLRGHEYALTEGPYLHRVDTDRLLSARLLLPAGVDRSIWLGTALMDSRGDFWLGTAQGLFRYSNVEFRADETREYHPAAAYTRADGLAGDHIAAIFEDRSGNLWVSSVPTGPEALAVRTRGATRWERLGAAHGLPSFNQLGQFFEDGQGAVWASLREGGVVRIRVGSAIVYGVEHGFPPIVGAGLADRNGQLWFGGENSVVRVVDPTADQIRATVVVSRLAGRAHVMEQGEAGEILVGTSQGLVSIDERTGVATRYYSTFDGLPMGTVALLTKGSDGTLLLRAGQSLVRLDPSRRNRAARRLRCVFSAVRLAGGLIPLPESGVEALQDIDVHPGRNHLEVEFVGLSPHISEPLAYEYRLTDVSDEWAQTTDRRIGYTGLAAGRYRFEVRARGVSDDSVSQPATLSFRVLPPWYLSTWFLTIAALALAALAYLAHRMRLQQAVYAEQLRSRIATDLHDDLGASLSQIAVISEVLRRRRSAMTADEEDGVLEKIGTTSRELVSSINDIVWAVNPRHDSLGDLVARMRWFAENLFAQSDTEFEFVAPTTVDHVRIGPVTKREIFLILKEGLTNIMKHACCQRAGVVLDLRGRELTLRVWDNGRGFDPDGIHQGNGIRNLRTRVARLRGRLTLMSAPEQGTDILLAIDIR